MMEFRFIIISGILLIILCNPTHGQFKYATEEVKYDTNYVEVYMDELTARLYIKRKQNGFNLYEKLSDPFVKYRTNDNLIIGIGYTYSFLTINLGVKMPFVNDDNDLYGQSKYFDLSTNFMFRAFIVDLYMQLGKGYYVSNPEHVYPFWDDSNDIMPQRGDMRTTIVGLNVQYLFNAERFSYKASFWQNEFQKRSAGSPILGIEGYWVLGMTDSMMVEPAMPTTGFMNDELFNQVDMLNMGVNGGYAYTFVWDEKLFLSLSTTFGLSGASNRVHYSPESYTLNKSISLGFSNTTRISLGFNSRKHYLGLSFTRFGMSSMAGSYRDWYSFNTGDIRINFAKRFYLKRPIKVLRPDLWFF
jgi:hypothetical protein